MPWTSPSILSGMVTFSGWNRPDPTAFLFALTGKMQIFKPGSVENAVYHYSEHGPYFQAALALGFYDTDLRDGKCRTKSQWDSGKYNIPVDENGNSVLTGDGQGKKDKSKTFRCEALQVFLVE